MATVTKFKCNKCGLNFVLQTSLLQNDLMQVGEGADLPSGGKLPDQETFVRLANEKTKQSSLDFCNALLNHQKECDGEVKLINIVFAH